jgi:glycosyltransferase involved in cell wall biosynthesis
MKTISLIIPAYNEEKHIASVISVALPLVGTHLHELIVVNDCSKDHTGEIVRGFPGVKLIEHTKNGGKSKTVADGILASEGEYIMLLDADLQYLTAQNITDLIAPIQDGSADFTVSYRKNAWPLWPFRQIDYLSGERIIAKSLLMPTIEQMAALPSYGLEVFLNRIIIAKKLRIKVVQWSNVENDFNQHKHGWLRGIRIIIGTWLDVLSVVSIFEMYGQNLKLRKQLVK